MEHYLTYKKLIELISQNLPIKIKSFNTGDLSYLGKENNPTLYPLMHVVPNQITYNENTTQFTLNILFCDIVNTDMSNEVNVISDMNLACRDFLSQIKLGVFYDYFDTDLPNTSTTFLERFNDHLGGVELNIPVTIFEDMNACDQYEPIPSPSPSPSVTPTPSLTPSITPSVTPSETPSVTPSLTPTPTPTPSSIPVTFTGMTIVGNSYTTFNGNTRNRIVRLNSDGTEDTAFYTNLGTAFTTGGVNTTITQPDGKIILAGTFGVFNGLTRIYLIRLNNDGTEDTAFYTNLGTSFNLILNWASLQSDGKIVVIGGFTTFNGNTRNRIVRLNSDGTEDTAFYTNVGTGFGAQLFHSAIQSDGKILVVGSYSTFNGNTRLRIVRLNSDGTEDTAFYTNLGTGFSGQINYVAPQSDGKIVIVGGFTTFNGNTRNRIARLNNDGTEDTAFYANLGTAFTIGPNDILIQSDGKILIAGNFTTFNGLTRNRLIRLNNDGTEDTAFYTNLGSAFGGTVTSLMEQPDGKILVAGAYSTFNGLTRNRLVRLNNDGTEDTAFYTNLGTGFNVGSLTSMSLN